MLEYRIHRLTAGLIALPLLFIASSLWAQEPGRGVTAEFEEGHLRFIIDHQYAALRMTEIAAGTAEIRQPDITNDEGVSPTPETEALDGRAELDVVRSIAREVNRRHREEILIAQSYLRDWYGVEHSPQISEENQAAIQNLEQTAAGSEFDEIFLQTLSRHHYQALAPSVNCIVGRDILHNQLYRLCQGILDTQLLEIEEMRELLSTNFGLDDYQAFAPPEEDRGTNGSGEGGATDDVTPDDGVPGSNNSVDGNPDDGEPQQEPVSSTEGNNTEGNNTQPSVVQSDADAEVL